MVRNARAASLSREWCSSWREERQDPARRSISFWSLVPSGRLGSGGVSRKPWSADLGTSTAHPATSRLTTQAAVTQRTILEPDLPIIVFFFIASAL